MPTSPARSLTIFATSSHAGALSSAVPQRFAWRSATASASSSRRRNPVFSRWSLRTSSLQRFSSAGRGFGPRFFPSARNAPSRACFRQADSRDADNPSRSSSRPIAPRSVHFPASATIRTLYSAVNRRRVADGRAAAATPATPFTSGHPPSIVRHRIGEPAPACSVPRPGGSPHGRGVFARAPGLSPAPVASLPSRASGP